MLAKFLARSRYIVIIAVLGSLVASFLVILFAAFDIIRLTVEVVREGVDHTSAGKHVAVGAIELIELFLLGTVLYIVSLGMYQLFIQRDVYLPEWLEIRSLDNLKERLLSTVLVMLAVTFLGYAVTWDGSANIAAAGIAVAAVIGTLAYTLKLARETGRDDANQNASGKS